MYVKLLARYCMVLFALCLKVCIQYFHKNYSILLKYYLANTPTRAYRVIQVKGETVSKHIHFKTKVLSDAIFNNIK